MIDNGKNDTFLVIRLPMSLKNKLLKRAKKDKVKLSVLVRTLLDK